MTSPKLYGPYRKHPPLLAELARGNTLNAAPQKHAPFVVVKDGVCRMFFRRPPGTNLSVASTDAFQWTGDPVLVFEENDARDACIRQFANIYHWCYCQWREQNGQRRKVKINRDFRQPKENMTRKVFRPRRTQSS